ncbi:DUF4304 domain-containing protein [Patulibacter americanus]|uniref:DUF4304 domain-containing protein n=1 Tax=Patulibacter americanus TaxID=588672 RepID=UPI0003B5E118|nr:DUF4304 domain-containing protein [Patulibacter americanus]
MTETTSKEVRAAFAACMKRAGVERKGALWYVRSSEVIVVFSLQKSQYAASFYWNVGFCLTTVDGGHERYPRPNDAHIRARAEGMFAAEEQHISALLDAESDVPPEERREGLCHFISERVLPFCADASTVDALREMVASGPLAHLPIWSDEARDVLDPL